MSTTTKRKTHVEYPANVVEFARRLYEQKGYTITRIRTALQRYGYNPSHTTVLCWVDPEYKASRYAHRNTNRNLGRPRKHAWRHRLERMRKLRAAGLSQQDIARVMELDFGLSLTRHQVDAFLRGKVSERTIRRNLWPDEAAA